MIEVKGLTKVFHDGKKGNVVAVDNVSFVCAPGKIFGLLGRNGAGKTTTLRMLATILTPTSGTATVQGHDVVRSPDKVREAIGYLSGDTKLYDRLSGKEALEYFGRLHGLSKESARERARHMIESLGMKEYADRKIGKMSTGMKQRVSIGRVMVHNPNVLILDEPAQGLDVLGAREVQKFMRNMKAEGKTILMSTHIMSEAEKLCDEIAIIEKGKILSSGGLEDLRKMTGERDLEEIFVKLVGEVSKELQT